MENIYKTNTIKNKNNLDIYQKYMEVIYYTNDILRKYPKCEKFAIVSEIKQQIYNGLSVLMYAIKSFEKKINFII